MSPHFLHSLLRLWLILQFLAGTVQADGGFKTSLLKPVPIPRQVAVLQHDGEAQTLTIWNTVETESQELAWVLPLPAPPDVIQETPAPAVQLLQTLCSPPVITGGADAPATILKTFPLCVLIGTGLCLLGLRRRRWGCRHKVWTLFVLLSIAAAFLFYMETKLMPGVRGAAAQKHPDVRVLMEKTAGSYGTTVISGESPGAVNAWLTANGFTAFEGEDLEVIRHYLAEKWVLFCAKLRTGGDGRTTAHPLTVRFPAKAPVYPMRLTQSAGTVPLDLYVIGGSTMTDPSGRLKPVMATEYNRMRLGNSGLWLKPIMELQIWAREDVGREMEPGNVLDDLPFVPAGQDVFLDALLTGGPAVTHLTATFSRDSDWSDVTLVPTDSREIKPVTHYTLTGFIEQVLLGAGLAGGIAFLALGCTAQSLTKSGQRPHPAWVLLTLALLGGGGFLCFHTTLRPMVLVDSFRVLDHPRTLPGGNEPPDSTLSLLRAWWNAPAPVTPP